jgi:DNA-binding CsgD family transcriptional regulator
MHSVFHCGKAKKMHVIGIISSGTQDDLFSNGLASTIKQMGIPLDPMVFPDVTALLTHPELKSSMAAVVIDANTTDANAINKIFGAHMFGDFTLTVVNHVPNWRADVPDSALLVENSHDAFLEALGKITSFGSTRVYTQSRGKGHARQANELSRREYECAQLVAKGMSNRKIAQITGLREQSVKNLVSVVIRKLNCENRVQVALKLSAFGRDVQVQAQVGEVIVDNPQIEAVAPTEAATTVEEVEEVEAATTPTVVEVPVEVEVAAVAPPIEVARPGAAPRARTTRAALVTPPQTKGRRKTKTAAV